jgi:transcriptional regulator with XRE-family HTH domain
MQGGRKMTENETLFLFGRRVKQLRTEKKLTQESLGYNVGLHRSYISQVECGKKNLTLRNISKIAQELDVNVSELTDFTKIK